MGRILATLFAVGLFGASAAAQDKIEEGRSISTCSNDTLVCAVMKDGSMRPTSECAARHDGAAQVIPGDCYDED